MECQTPHRIKGAKINGSYKYRDGKRWIDSQVDTPRWKEELYTNGHTTEESREERPITSATNCHADYVDSGSASGTGSTRLW